MDTRKPNIHTYLSKDKTSPTQRRVWFLNSISSNVPGIYTEDQIAGYKRVAESVHAKGGFVYMQLWALGRTADPSNLASKGHELVGAGDIPLEGHPAPEPLSGSDIERYVRSYAEAARNAVLEAGFDGVEIHAANGYCK